jgi:hypothetical protein
MNCMNLTRSSLLRLLTYGLAGIALAVVIGYAAWRSFDYLRGPTIEIFQPADGSTIASSSITILGRADRINTMNLNGRSIAMNEEGYFAEILIIFPGVNIISLSGTDQFGRSSDAQIRLFGSASSTPL